ncbi:N-acyl homoserine lactonase family protein [Microbacterium sp. No. 7]|uniref:N-acyl homoserine lactonase family protein n=1 Tax=Microbacterium sp. No. 7 TaxID=1714373 RepID=UPI0006CF4D9F|nr:N-acyl homoserine lactonase family protein [Microbacterium sp. No. 7]ALJ20018.1 MBL fold metallo-hydrolase [Microbacterium sp. No. 7]
MTNATRLWALDGAFFTLPLNLIVLGGQGMTTLPIPVYVIEHPDGLIVFDTGVAPEAWDDPRAVYGPLVDVFELTCPPENLLERQFAKTGYTFDDVTHVIVSHGHFDHTGGMYLFPQAKFYMSEEDLRYTFWPDDFCAGFYRHEDIERTRGFEWHPISSDLDLFGDGSIQILRTPGHTHGQLSLLVDLPSRPVLLTADAVHVRANIDQKTPCPVDLDTSTALRSVERIRQVAESAGADIWVMHDTADWETFTTEEGWVS